MPKKILFVGGGSLGHVAPSVAVWQALQILEPEAQALFVCTNRPDETEFLHYNAVPHTSITIARIGVLFPIKFCQAIAQSCRIFWQFKPDVIFSKGGFVSVPLCFVGWLLGIPIVLHESDTVTGRANSLVSKWASVICQGLKTETPSGKYIFTGNPVRPSLLSKKIDDPHGILGIDPNRPTIYVSGGSQGSEAINNAIYTHLPALLTNYNVLHVTGRGKQKAVDVPIELLSYYKSWEFITVDQVACLAAANIAIIRSSATTISECAAFTIPIIAVPLRGLANDHQQKNAQYLVQVGAGICVQQEVLPQFLEAECSKLCTNTTKLAEMQLQLKGLFIPNSAKKIATIILAEITVQISKK